MLHGCKVGGARYFQLSIFPCSQFRRPRGTYLINPPHPFPEGVQNRIHSLYGGEPAFREPIRMIKATYSNLREEERKRHERKKRREAVLKS